MWIGRSVGRFIVRGHGRSVGRSVGSSVSRSAVARPSFRARGLRHGVHSGERRRAIRANASTWIFYIVRLARNRARRDVGTSRREARDTMEGDRRHRRRDPGASVGVRAGRREERRRVTSVDRGTNSMTDDVARALFLDAVRRLRARLHARPRRRQVRRETPRKGITTRPNRPRERRARSRSARGGMKWA